MSEIKVSVIMPVYNVEKYLRQALDSVKNQSLQEIEVICVDDGSKDSSLKILQEYSKEDPRFSVLHQQNQFAGVARNRGLEAATGKYVVFWDSDDWFEKDALELMYNQCEADNAQICVCASDKYDELSKIRFRFYEYLLMKRVPSKRPFAKEDLGRYLFNFTTNIPWNKMFLRSFIEEEGLRFQSLQQANDVYFVMLALYKATAITVVEKPLIIYRVANENSLSGKAATTRYCTAQAFEAVWDELNENSANTFASEYRQSFANKAIGPLINAWRSQKGGNAAQEMFDYYKEQLFPKLGLLVESDDGTLKAQEEGFYNNPNDAEIMKGFSSMDCLSFMLFEMRHYSRLYRVEQAKSQQKIRELKQTPIWKLGWKASWPQRKLGILDKHGMSKQGKKDNREE